VAPDVFDDLERPPLDAAALARALAGPDRPWREVRVVDRTPSTNADLVAEARAGTAGGLVLVAEEQTAGRGRLDRSWTSPARSGLTCSVLLRPEVDRSRWGWLPLLAGLAAAEAVGRLAEVDVTLKWPNDLVVRDRKLAGLLAEQVDDAVVLGLGLNVTLRAAELPVPGATSLAIEGAVCTDRDPLLRAVLRRLAERLAAWTDSGGEPAAGLGADYRTRCATLGRTVRVDVPGGAVVEGEAVDVDAAGRLVVRTATGTVALAAGDVVHLR
jgi:BirA family biotin operon repressor/biotin-[acetyl-CoA-carboxylase] ligase